MLNMLDSCTEHYEFTLCKWEESRLAPHTQSGTTKLPQVCRDYNQEAMPH